MDITIRTNNHKRLIVYGFELTPRERADWDLLDPETLNEGYFVRYKGSTLYLGDFLWISHDSPLKNDKLGKWDGYQNDTFFSGVLIRYPDSTYDHVVVGEFYS